MRRLIAYMGRLGSAACLLSLAAVSAAIGHAGCSVGQSAEAADRLAPVGVSALAARTGYQLDENVALAREPIITKLSHYVSDPREPGKEYEIQLEFSSSVKATENGRYLYSYSFRNKSGSPVRVEWKAFEATELGHKASLRKIAYFGSTPTKDFTHSDESARAPALNFFPALIYLSDGDPDRIVATGMAPAYGPE